MSFNLFGPTTKKDIRVGYISPERGYVKNISILEANEYAFLNPGTMFILETRDSTRYLTINEVNNLTPQDILPQKTAADSTCDGLTGLTPETAQSGGTPIVSITGCSGVGAQANAVIGRDGSILDVNVVRGGFGYKCPPHVTIFDPNRRGNGVVAISSIGISTVPTVEYYTDEEDFEEYDFSAENGPEALPGYGSRFDVNGNVLGDWDPTLFASFANDPIRDEIQKYQDFLRELPNPWWHTRKEKPLRVTFRNKTSRVVHNVSYFGSGVKSMIGFDYSLGNQDNEGVFFGYEVDYPKAKAEGYSDADIRYYLENDFPGLLGPKMQEVLSDPNWGKIDRNGGWASYLNLYAISPVPPSNVPGTSYPGRVATFEWEEDFPYTGEYKIRGMSDGYSKFFLDNELLLQSSNYIGGPEKVIKKTVQEGVHKIRVELLNRAAASGSTKEIFSTSDYINKADRKLWRTNVYPNASFLNDYGVCPFDTQTILPDNPYDGTHVIRWQHVTFPEDGNYNIEVEVDDRVKIYIGNRSGNGAMEIGNGLISVEEGGDEVIIEKNGFISGSNNKGTGKSTYTRFFKKGNYRIRAELFQQPGGKFGFEGSKSVSRKSGLEPAISARFSREGNDIYLIVGGEGTATVNFTLNVDDNPRIAGDSLGSLRVGNVNLRRTRSGSSGYKEKEVLTGSGTFTAGEKYKVVVSGASAGVGQPRVGQDAIEFLDKSGNDANATLKITKLSNVQPASVKGLNPMALAMRITTSSEGQRISAKSWNEDPMGVGYTIEAPFPPVPQEPIPVGEGRCPKNPMWTTRFPGANQKWWPVNHTADDGTKTWSPFMNRYAISPIPPLDSPNTDGGGIVYSNTWNIEIPYDGFYALKGAVDNGGRILVDGDEKVRGGYFDSSTFKSSDGRIDFSKSQKGLSNFRAVSPPLTKFFLEKGQHTITVEVDNKRTTEQKSTELKIFSTRDWINGPKGATGIKSMIGFDYSQGNQDNEGVFFGYEVDYPKAKSEGFSDADIRYYLENDFPGILGPKMKQVLSDPNWGRIPVRNRDGITYSGPKLFQINSQTTVANWSRFMRRNAVSPYIPPLNEDNPAIANAEFTYTWSNVRFPESGSYKILFQTDNTGELYINGELIKKSRSFRGDPQISYAEISAGTYQVKVVCRNGSQPVNILLGNNPTGFALKIVKDTIISGNSLPWTTNPVGISAILIPPPCPKVIDGKGIVTDIIVKEPGNGFTTSPGPGYPTIVTVKGIDITSPGINYSPDDNILINGNPVSICKIDGFGRVLEVCPLPPESPIIITEYPDIRLPSDTGVGFRGTPIVETTIVPEDVFDPEDLIQVTDLVGLKQTGYVNGKPYYGSVFSKDGQLYAGVYETIGDLVPVYATLQESIDNQVTTRPSAILRQGTDVNSNNPRLNIPGTPENLV